VVIFLHPEEGGGKRKRCLLPSPSSERPKAFSLGRRKGKKEEKKTANHPLPGKGTRGEGGRRRQGVNLSSIAAEETVELEG